MTTSSYLVESVRGAVQARASPVRLWRVLTNVVDNGTGFGTGSPGAASLGLGVATSQARIVIPVEPR
jgi:hypothetical protein